MNTQEQQLVENDKSGNSSEENQEIDLRTILNEVKSVKNEVKSVKSELEKKIEFEVKSVKSELEKKIEFEVKSVKSELEKKIEFEVKSIKIHLEKLENEIKLTNERLELMELKTNVLQNLVTSNINGGSNIREYRGEYVSDGTGINSRRRRFVNNPYW